MKESKHKMKLYHGTNYSSAINIVNHGIDLKYSKPYLDFGPGFYTTPSYDHAALAAIRTTQKYNAKNNKNEEPYIVEVDYKPISAMDLVIGSYPRHSERWGKFVLNNRLKPQMLSAYNILEHNQDGKYDICYGEIADGNIINIAYKVNGGQVIPEDINYKEFLKDNGEVYPQQYSFHTLKAISCIKVLSCDMINNKKKSLNARGRR